MPESKKALVLMDSSPTTDAILNVTFKERRSVRVNGINTEYKIAENWNEWNDIVKNSKGYDMIIIPTFHAVKDDNGHPVSFEKVVEWTSLNSSVPIFAHQDYTVGPRGTVGSYVVYGEAHGKLAGEIVLEILDEKKLPRKIWPKMDQEGNGTTLSG